MQNSFQKLSKQMDEIKRKGFGFIARPDSMNEGAGGESSA
jgi:hypothetical protein